MKKKMVLFTCDIDHMELNKLTVKNCYPLPRIDDLFDQLRGACPFLKIDFHQDIISYECMRMPFQRPPSFSNDIDILSLRFVIIFIDDIQAYSKSKEEHEVSLKLRYAAEKAISGVLRLKLCMEGNFRLERRVRLAPRYVGPFKILERIGLVAYRLRLSEELNSVHDTFHVSNLKKCLADANLHIPLDEIKVDKTLRFVEEPVEIMDREI
ncbi:hypothetical protein Tco_0873731 [Tanacetum coccineum]|uniref:Tf2-1-like SH3-like domain-containing protein n=1 Tax=Tanacetum coccineum TaxID=301880 RepID=A0ABQ5BJM9_9ASTR